MLRGNVATHQEYPHPAAGQNYDPGPREVPRIFRSLSVASGALNSDICRQGAGHASINDRNFANKQYLRIWQLSSSVIYAIHSYDESSAVAVIAWLGNEKHAPNRELVGNSKRGTGVPLWVQGRGVHEGGVQVKRLVSDLSQIRNSIYPLRDKGYIP